MKFKTVRTALAFVVLLSATPASADLIQATIPGADFSANSTIGTFVYALPVGADITQVLFFSPEFSFPSAPDTFNLQFDFDGVGALAGAIPPGDTSFFLGNDVTFLSSLFTDGSMELSVFCFMGPCPDIYTRLSGDWTLLVTFTPSLVPEPSTILLTVVSLTAPGLRHRRRRRP